jgi:hypothetical protein
VCINLNPLEDIPSQSVAVNKIIYGSHGEESIIRHPGCSEEYDEKNKNEQIDGLPVGRSHVSVSGVIS